MKIKQFFTDILYRIYYPFIVRKEKLAATKMWREGVKQCIKMYQELASSRVYLFFDRKHMVWAPMTYEPNKQYKPSFRVYRRMGKMRGMSKVRDVEDMKRYSYYYTPSKWGALGCDEDNQVRTEKLKQWVNYYMLCISEPMKKCRQYRQRTGRRLPE